MRALPPREAIALAVQFLCDQGFVLVAANERRDSVYLRRGDDGSLIRVSNHARTPTQRRNHPDVATSLVFRGAKSRAQIEAMVTSAARNFAAAHRGEAG